VAAIGAWNLPSRRRPFLVTGACSGATWQRGREYRRLWLELEKTWERSTMAGDKVSRGKTILSPENLMELISFREFARRNCVSDMAISKAVKAGRLPSTDGKIDFEQAQPIWDRIKDPLRAGRKLPPE
jgi:hypothetical protein